MSEQKTCETCRWFDPSNPEMLHGLCRYEMPPAVKRWLKVLIPVDRIHEINSFVAVPKVWLCGEHIPKGSDDDKR